MSLILPRGAEVTSTRSRWPTARPAGRACVDAVRCGRGRKPRRTA